MSGAIEIRVSYRENVDMQKFARIEIKIVQKNL